jgi:hypothetical protein
MEVGGGVGVACGKCEKLLKKKRSSKFFRTGMVCVLKKRSPNIPASPPNLISPYAPWGGGAKFISSPWAQKWLATALSRVLCVLIISTLAEC